MDKYHAYQLLDDEWSKIATDLEIIQTEGFDAIKKTDPKMVLKKKDGKEVEVQDGWMGHVIPFDLVQKIYLSDKLAVIKSKEEELSNILSQYEEIIESIPEEDRGDFLNDDNSAFVAKEVAKAIKPFAKGKNKPDIGSIEEILIKVNALIEKEKALKKEVKILRTELHNETKDFIENMSEEEAHCTLKAKWITPIVESILLLPDSIVSGLESKIHTLTKKYSVTMLEAEEQIAQSEKAVAAMIDDLEGDEFDMKGLKELQKMLKGE